MSIPALFPPHYNWTWHIPISHIDSSPIKDAFARNAHEEIIQDQTLFWSAYCLTYQLVRNEPIFNSEHLPWDNKLFYTQQCIEKIRKVFQRHLSTKTNFSLIVIPDVHDIYFEEDETRERIFFDKGRAINLSTHYLQQNIIPIVSKLCEQLNIGFSQKKVPRTLISFGPRDQKLNFNCYSFTWGRTYSTYPIPPKVVITEPQDKIYELYQTQLLCDFTLRTEEGNIAVHSLILQACGGGVLKAMLKNRVTETLEKSLSMTNYSLNTVKAFVDFLYLGEKGITPDSVVEKEVALYELLALAHFYQLDPLINHCTNLLSLFASVEDWKYVRQLAELYNNEHLHTLSAYLRKAKLETS